MHEAVTRGAAARPRAWLGYLAILTGLALNKWALERVLAPDEHIASTGVVTLIVLFQLGWIAIGAGFLGLRSRIRLGEVATWTAGAVLTAALLFGIYANLRALGLLDPYREVKSAWAEVNAAEELLLALTPELRRLDRSVENLALPDRGSRELFGDEVSVRDLPAAEVEEWQLPTVSVTVRDRRPEGGERPVAAADLRLWQPLLDGVDYFQHAGFRFVAGHFVDGGRDRYETELHFAGLARTGDGRWSSIDVDQTVLWRRRPEAGTGAAGWRIAGWTTERWTVKESPGLLFDEVLDRAVADPEDLRRARRSIHEELVREHFVDPAKVLASEPYFKPTAVDLHPGVAVVDLDRDGYDDLYVSVRWGSNLFFRNRGDGTFEEIAGEIGLDLPEANTAAAVFGDFDNDGDDDAFLARTFDRSLYLVNEGGRFVDRSSDLVDGSLPCMASSASAVDYNADGLLDVYVSTYGAAIYLAGKDPGRLMERCLSEADRRQWIDKNVGERRALWNAFGPPNVMLRNRGGGRFETVRLMPDLLRMTFQSTWSDYDGDGDPDVYLANDFAPNNLLRNDGSGDDGTVRFTDVTAETGAADVGFSMGASWGDYDNDGRHDLYVSNMFSKAGRRITRGIPDVDPRLQTMSRGNSLFKNTVAGFRRVSGLTPDRLQVEKAGWSWGSQLADLDNDGFLDVYALSGFFTMPAPFEQPVDL